jgi:hypothetical protein
MEYTTLGEKLILPEYGRNIQQMVAHAMTLEKEKKNPLCQNHHQYYGKFVSILKRCERF